MNSFPTSSMYDESSIFNYQPTFYEANYEREHSFVRPEQSEFLQLTAIKSQQEQAKPVLSEKTLTIICPQCHKGELKPMFINFDECLIICTKSTKKSPSEKAPAQVVSNNTSTQQLLSRGQEQQDCEMIEPAAQKLASTFKNEDQTPCNDRCSLKRTDRSSALCTIGADPLAQNFQSRGMNICKISPFAPSYNVIVNSDTNNDFLQMKQVNQDEKECLFPLEMQDPWNNLNISDFTCNEKNLNETLNNLNNKILAIQKGNFKSKIQLQAIQYLKQIRNPDLDEEDYAMKEYQKEQNEIKYEAKLKYNNQRNHQPGYNSTFDTPKKFDFQSFHANQSTNSSTGPLGMFH